MKFLAPLVFAAALIACAGTQTPSTPKTGCEQLFDHIQSIFVKKFPIQHRTAAEEEFERQVRPGIAKCEAANPSRERIDCALATTDFATIERCIKQ